MRLKQKDTPKKRPRTSWTPKTAVELVAAVARVLQAVAAIIAALT